MSAWGHCDLASAPALVGKDCSEGDFSLRGSGNGGIVVGAPDKGTRALGIGGSLNIPSICICMVLAELSAGSLTGDTETWTMLQSSIDIICSLGITAREAIDDSASCST